MLAIATKRNRGPGGGREIPLIDQRARKSNHGYIYRFFYVFAFVLVFAAFA